MKFRATILARTTRVFDVDLPELVPEHRDRAGEITEKGNEAKALAARRRGVRDAEKRIAAEIAKAVGGDVEVIVEGIEETG